MARHGGTGRESQMRDLMDKVYLYWMNLSGPKKVFALGVVGIVALSILS